MITMIHLLISLGITAGLVGFVHGMVWICTNWPDQSGRVLSVLIFILFWVAIYNIVEISYE